MERNVDAPVNVDYGRPLPNHGLSGSEHVGLAGVLFKSCPTWIHLAGIIGHHGCGPAA